MIAPDEFIPLADKTGMILALGRRGLELVALHIAESEGLIVAVNLSARQLTAPDLAETISGILERAGAPCESLVLEITESVLMTDVETHVAVLQALRHKGVRISIDDFGTGYSSLAYLRRLPLDCLKIDRSFVAELADSADARAIVSTIIDLAHNLRLKVVGEGAEAARQADCLRAMCCDML